MLGFDEEVGDGLRLPLSDVQLRDGLLRRQHRMDVVVGGVQAQAARQVLLAWLTLVKV